MDPLNNELRNFSLLAGSNSRQLADPDTAPPFGRRHDSAAFLFCEFSAVIRSIPISGRNRSF